MNRRSRRAAKVLALAVLACAGTCGLLRTREGALKGTAQASPEERAAASHAPAKMPPNRPLASSSSKAEPRPPAAPIIDEITVEKAEVCEGEENLVTVRAHTPDGNDAFLHYQVGPRRGSSVALRSYFDDHGKPTQHRLTVFGKNNVATSALVPSFRVKSCTPAPVAVIAYRLRPNTWAEFDFDVKLAPAVPSRNDSISTAAPLRWRTFRWSFGDGSRDETREPHATHSFEARGQNTLYSQFLVAVEAIADDGRTFTARQTLELLNPAYEAFAYKGIVQLLVELNPKFPALSGADVVDQGVRLWHVRPEAVEITKITVRSQYVDGAGRSPPEYPSIASVLGTAHIPRGRGLELHAVLDTRLEPDVFSRDYYLEGRTSDGHPVRGAFSVMKPPPPPTKDRNDPVVDPVLLAKVKLARDLLHREYVTDEDLWSLEQAGQFANLRVDPATATPPTAPPANLPKPPFPVTPAPKAAPRDPGPPPVPTVTGGTDLSLPGPPKPERPPTQGPPL